MKKQLHFLLITAMLCAVNLIPAQEGVNQTFGASNNWAVANKVGGTSSISGGHLNVVMGETTAGSGSYRADLQFNNTDDSGSNFIINSTTDKILAVKFIGDRPSTGSLKLELHIDGGAWINRGGGRYNIAGNTTTTAGNKIYYFDFSGDAEYVAGNLEIDRLNIVIADATQPSSYSIDWVATFTDTAALEAYKDVKDDGSSDTEGTFTLGIDDVDLNHNSFKIYPNPSTGNSFSIELNRAYSKGNEFVKVYNLLGSLVIDKEINTADNKVTLNHNLRTGIYIVKVANHSTKLIVK